MEYCIYFCVIQVCFFTHVLYSVFFIIRYNTHGMTWDMNAIVAGELLQCKELFENKI